MTCFRTFLAIIFPALFSICCDAQTRGAPGLILAVDDGEIILSLRSMKINVNVVHGIAEVSMIQTFFTPPGNWTSGESRYQLPMDDRAAVTSFVAMVDDRIIRAVAKEREEARKDFKEALARGGGSAYLAERQRRDIFRISVGNLPPGTPVRIELVYVRLLESVAGNEVKFFLPTGISPRYEPPAGRGGGGRDGVDYHEDLIDGDVSFELNAAMASKILKVRSPSHTIQVTPKNNRFTNVRVTDEDFLTRDLVIYIRTRWVFRPQLFLEYSELYSSAAMLLTFVPQNLAEDVAKKYECIFVVDRSSSMGNKMLQTRKALSKVIESLPDKSLFNIVGFGDTFVFLFEESQSADNSTSLTAAFDHIDTMTADLGGTDILGPLKKLYSIEPKPGFHRQIFVFTDGQVTNTEETIKFVRKFKSNSARVFSLGIGDHASRHLVQGIAKSGRGTAEFVEGNIDSAIYEAVERQMDVSQSPVLDDLRIDWGAHTSGGEQAPYITPPLLQGERYIAYYMSSEIMAVSGRPDNLSVTVAAYHVASDEKYEFEVTADDMIVLDGAYSDNMIHKMAAQAQIADLEDGGARLTILGEDVVTKKIVELGIRYQLSSSETSFVAVDNYNWTEAGNDGLFLNTEERSSEIFEPIHVGVETIPSSSSVNIIFSLSVIINLIICIIII